MIRTASAWSYSPEAPGCARLIRCAPLCHPRRQLADRLRERRVRRVTDDLQRVRKHLDAAQVLGAGIAHRVDQIDERHLAVPRLR